MEMKEYNLIINQIYIHFHDIKKINEVTFDDGEYIDIITNNNISKNY